MNGPTRFSLVPAATTAALAFTLLIGAAGAPAAAQGVVRAVDDHWQIAVRRHPGRRPSSVPCFKASSPKIGPTSASPFWFSKPRIRNHA